MAQGVLPGATSSLGLNNLGQDFPTPQCQGLKQGWRKSEIGNPEGIRLWLQVNHGNGL